MIKLTQTVQKGGCAAKIAATELKKILNLVQFPPHSEKVLVDGSTMDDAGIYKVNEELALVQTLDFFTPIVDSPRKFGAIAAANALSDVYAMGGVPATAMAILAFPLVTLPNELIAEVLQGASDKIKESGSQFIGGHSIDDDTLKFGLSVTGFVHPEKIWTNAKAKIGDRIILIKPIGTGTVTAALKRQTVTESDIENVLSSMEQLNNIHDLLSVKELHEIHAATDLTGFGLAGHAVQMAKASHVNFKIEFNKIPLFEQTKSFLKEGFLTKAHRTNREYAESSIKYLAQIQVDEKNVLYDPQTSGGLFLSVSDGYSSDILKKLKSRFPMAEIIGEVCPHQEESLTIL
jgi:selenide,water dikinase